MEKIVRFISRLQLVVGVVCLCVFLIAILIQVFTRYLGISVIWTEEVANYSFIWAIFMGAAVMVHHDEHFAFSAVIDKVDSVKRKLVLVTIKYGCIIGFSMTIFLLGLRVVRTFWRYRWITIPRLQMGYVWVVLPVMGGTMVLYALQKLWSHYRAAISSTSERERE